jgi:hypothetical protein
MTDSVASEAGQQSCGPALDTDRLFAEIRLFGFDRRQNLVVTYLVWFGSSRDAAFDARAQAMLDGWRVTLHGDGTGWVARLSRQGPVRVSRLRLDAVWVERFAAELGGVVRGVAVEDLDCPGYPGSRNWDTRYRDTQNGDTRDWDSPAAGAAGPNRKEPGSRTVQIPQRAALSAQVARRA